jgi:hypothetical protein
MLVKSLRHSHAQATYFSRRQPRAKSQIDRLAPILLRRAPPASTSVFARFFPPQSPQHGPFQRNLTQNSATQSVDKSPQKQPLAEVRQWVHIILCSENV